MKNNENNAMSATELRDIMAKQLRELDQSNVLDRNIGKKIDIAKQVFNGAGKMIALAAYTAEANKMGTNSEILSFPLTPEQPKKLAAPKPNSDEKK